MKTQSVRFAKLLGTLALGIGATIALAPADASAAEGSCQYGNYSAESGEWLEYFGTSYYCEEGNWSDQKSSCWYAGAWTAHGGTLMSYECNDGAWKEIGRDDYKQCSHEGESYAHGDKHAFNGYEQGCDDGKWKQGDRVYCMIDSRTYPHGHEVFGTSYKYQCDTGEWKQVAYEECRHNGASYAHGYEHAFNGYEQKCDDGKWKQGDKVYCSYERDRYEHKETRVANGYKYQCETGEWKSVGFDRCEYNSKYYDHGEYDYRNGYKWQCDDGQWEKDAVACEWQGQWAEEGEWLSGATLTCECTSTGWSKCRSVSRGW